MVVTWWNLWWKADSPDSILKPFSQKRCWWGLRVRSWLYSNFITFYADIWSEVMWWGAHVLWLNVVIERLIRANSITTRFNRAPSTQLIRNSTLAGKSFGLESSALYSATHQWAIIPCVGAVKGLERGARSPTITGENKQATTFERGASPRPSKAVHLLSPWVKIT